MQNTSSVHDKHVVTQNWHFLLFKLLCKIEICSTFAIQSFFLYFGIPLNSRKHSSKCQNTPSMLLSMFSMDLRIQTNLFRFGLNLDDLSTSDRGKQVSDILGCGTVIDTLKLKLITKSYWMLLKLKCCINWTLMIILAIISCHFHQSHLEILCGIFETNFDF